jgi:glycosyltransferase involved in cell wall biosynthesis
LKIGLIYNSPFHILSVFQRPVDRAQAAVTYLAIELSKLGHDITLFSQTANNIGAFDIRCRSINIENDALNLDKAILETDYDALIVKNAAPEFVAKLKEALPYKAKMFLWTEFDFNNPINNSFQDEQVLKQIDGIICVSEWQRTRLTGKLLIPRDKTCAILYAISPLYENMFVDGKEFINVKSKSPLLAYTAAPLTGLDVLLDTCADVENNYPDSQINIFAGNHEYGAEDDRLVNIYKMANHFKRLKQVGTLSDIQLAARLRTHTMLTYPCTIEETANVEIMEALAAGLYVITSNMGAIPEYCSDHGKCISQKNLHVETLDSFIGQVLSICQSQVHSPSVFYDFCYKQTVEINKMHTWRVRAREWVKMLHTFLGYLELSEAPEKNAS